jgi:hypothetical protein
MVRHYQIRPGSTSEFLEILRLETVAEFKPGSEAYFDNFIEPLVCADTAIVLHFLKS